MAAFEDSTVSHKLSSTEAFRAWGKKISDGLQEIGLTKTEDTGQIDWETVELPEEDEDAGYEVYRFNDELQATRPIFFKLIYGRGDEEEPKLTMQVGNASNGSGELEGSTYEQTFEQGVSGGYSEAGYIHMCYKDSAFHLLVCANTGQTSNSGNNTVTHLFVIERLRSFEDGSLRDTDLADAVIRFNETHRVRNGAEWNASAGQYSLGESAIAENEYMPQIVFPFSTSSGPVGPCISHVYIHESKAGPGDEGSVSLNGTSRNYRRANISQQAGTSATGSGIAVLLHE